MIKLPTLRERRIMATVTEFISRKDAWAKKLNHFLDGAFEAGSPSDFTLVDVSQQVPPADGSLCLDVQVEPEQSGKVIFSNALFAQLTDHLLGVQTNAGSEELQTPGPYEFAVMEPAGVSILRLFFRSNDDADLEIETGESGSQEPNSRTHSTLYIRFQSDSSPAQWLVVAMEHDDLHSATSKHEQSLSTSGIGQMLLANVPVELQGRLAGTTVSLRDVSNLRVGQVFSLHAKKDQLKLNPPNGDFLFYAELQPAGVKMAARVLSLVKNGQSGAQPALWP